VSQPAAPVDANTPSHDFRILTFELWLILHFLDHSKWLDNSEARRVRRQLDDSCDKGLDASLYMSRAADAARRAANLERRHEQDGTVFPHDNPSSGMYHLVAAVEPRI
jgi:hypothetical protein